MEATTQARDRQEEARLFYERKKCQETAEADTIFNGTIKDTLAKKRSA